MGGCMGGARPPALTSANFTAFPRIHSWAVGQDGHRTPKASPSQVYL